MPPDMYIVNVNSRSALCMVFRHWYRNLIVLFYGNPLIRLICDAFFQNYGVNIHSAPPLFVTIKIFEKRYVGKAFTN